MLLLRPRSKIFLLVTLCIATEAAAEVPSYVAGFERLSKADGDNQHLRKNVSTDGLLY